jgi:hypothetical protein
MLDEYDSCPSYFGDNDNDLPEGGDAILLCGEFGVPAPAIVEGDLPEGLDMERVVVLSGADAGDGEE